MYWDSNDDQPDLEPLGEYNLPWTSFHGLKVDVVVADKSGPVEGLIRRTGRRFSEGVVELVRSVLPENRSPKAFETIALKEFLERHPHPKARTPYCKDGMRGTQSADWVQGAPFCVFCRDRLALVEALERSPAVRVMPVRS